MAICGLLAEQLQSSVQLVGRYDELPAMQADNLTPKDLGRGYPHMVCGDYGSFFGCAGGRADLPSSLIGKIKSEASKSFRFSLNYSLNEVWKRTFPPNISKLNFLSDIGGACQILREALTCWTKAKSPKSATTVNCWPSSGSTIICGLPRSSNRPAKAPSHSAGLSCRGNAEGSIC